VAEDLLYRFPHTTCVLILLHVPSYYDVSSSCYIGVLIPDRHAEQTSERLLSNALYECPKLLVYECPKLLVYECPKLLVYECPKLLVYECPKLLVHECHKLLVHQCHKLLVYRALRY
jgi:hypothetical protein